MKILRLINACTKINDQNWSCNQTKVGILRVLALLGDFRDIPTKVILTDLCYVPLLFDIIRMIKSIKVFSFY